MSEPVNKCSACQNDEHYMCGYKLGNDYWCDCECLSPTETIL